MEFNVLDSLNTKLVRPVSNGVDDSPGIYDDDDQAINYKALIYKQ